MLDYDIIEMQINSSPIIKKGWYLNKKDIEEGSLYGDFYVHADNRNEAKTNTQKAVKVFLLKR